MSAPGFGDIVTCIQLANLLYTNGFQNINRAPVLYNQFGKNIKHLATNLGDLQKLIEAVSGNGMPNSTDSVYLGSLCDIIGDYRTTLQDCERLLNDNAKFSRRGDFIHNIVWNFTVASDVQALKDRVSFLNIKLLTLLKTLDLQMAQKLSIDIFRIHQDLAARIDEVHINLTQQIQNLTSEIRNHFTGSIGAITSNAQTRTRPFDIPTSLDGLFEGQIRGLGVDISHFPLVRGLDAVVYHVNGASMISADNKESKRERLWLEIAKAVWVVTRVKAGQEYAAACSFRSSNTLESQLIKWGVTIASYVRGLEIELIEIAKASDVINFIPGADAILEAYHQDPELWLAGKKDVPLTPAWELGFSENIMSAPLKGPYQGYDQSLRLFRLTEVDLKLVISDVPSDSARSGQRTNNIINVDLRRARFIPLYATSTSSSSALNVNFQGDSLAAGSTAVSFTHRRDLLKFQQAITGYKVVFEAQNIQVTSYVPRRFGVAKIQYTGRLQLWRSNCLKNSTETSSGSSRSSVSQTKAATSPTTSFSSSPISKRISSFSSIDASSPKRRDSAATVNSGLYSGRRGSTATTSPSVFSVVEALHSSASTIQTSIMDKEGSIGILLDKPKSSMLVFYLEQAEKESTSKELSFLIIDLNEAVYIQKSSCDCRKPENSCLRSVIHRSSNKPMRIYRHDAGTKLEDWNLAKLGEWQKESLPASSEVIYITADFQTLEDRIGFVDVFEKLKKIFIHEEHLYHKDLANLRS